MGVKTILDARAVQAAPRNNVFLANLMPFPWGVPRKKNWLSPSGLSAGISLFFFLFSHSHKAGSAVACPKIN
jgi:hypothetical protein